MIRKLVFATDFSGLSRQALYYTRRLAQKTGAKIIGVFALKPPGPLLPPLESMQAHVEEVSERSRKRLEEFFAGLVKAGIDVQTRLCVGPPEQALSQIAREEEADLIVVAKHRHSGLKTFLFGGNLGSNTQRILREAACPVLVVTEGRKRGLEWQPIVCGTDFSAASLQAFRFALGLAREYGGRISLLHVIELSYDGEEEILNPDHYIVWASNEAREKLKAIVKEAQADGEVDILVDAGKAPSVLLKKAASLGSDLIVVGKSGATLLEERLLGSTTNEVLRSAPCPVLVVPSKK